MPTANPFGTLPTSPVPEQFKQLAQPPHETLAEFIHGCSPDSKTRTVATTALTLSLWQLQGHSLTPDVPSLLLIRPEETHQDPIDDFVRSVVYNEEENKPRVQTKGPFMYGDVDLAPEAMQNAMRIRRSLGRHIPPGDFSKQSDAQTAEEKFRAAQTTAHGHGRSRSYSKAWHPEYGLLTGPNDQLILRLNDGGDRAAFCEDFLNKPSKILFPEGVGSDLFPTPKTASISGALTTELWTEKLARRMLASGKPFFVLPHGGDSQLGGECLHSLWGFTTVWKCKRFHPIHASVRLPADPWIRGYHDALRKRLAALPLPAEFATLQVIHQLAEICELIVNVACGPNTSRAEAVALSNDLYRHTLRGLVIGTASCSWFGLGLSLGPVCELLRAKAMKIITKLRSAGPISKSDLLKNHHLKKLERDELLARLIEENLIHVDGKHVAATTYQQFLEGLYARVEFPPVQNFWEEILQHRKAGEAATA